MSDRSERICVTCHTESPEVETAYTLISGRYGWRLIQRKTDDGETIPEWRCPKCWALYKSRRAAEAPRGPGGSIPPPGKHR